MRIYIGGKAAIEGGSWTEGAIAYATDTDELGAYDGAVWGWQDMGVIADHDHTGDAGDGRCPVGVNCLYLY